MNDYDKLMNKPDTKDLRRIADTFYSSSVCTYLRNCADFIDSLEGKTIVEWPKHLTREWLIRLADEEWKSEAPRVALKDLAAIAPEAPKKRMMGIWVLDDGSEPMPVLKPLDWVPSLDTKWRKIGRFVVDE